MKAVILGAKVDAVDMEGAVDRIRRFIREGTSHHVITLNAEIIYRAQQEPELMQVINQADLVTPDGAGVVWAARYLGTPVPERVTGIDLMLELARAASAEGWRLYLYGAAPGVAEKAAQNLQKKHKNLQIVGTSHGFLTSNDMGFLVQDIKAKRPDILLVALGAPGQEYWIREHLDQLGVPVCMGVGGSFDVVAGKIKRAPRWVQRVHAEWLYRLVKEPRRFKRMLALPKFMWLVLTRGKRVKP